MADDKLKWDRWQQVEDALKKSAADSEGKSSRLVCVAICQGWNPPSIRTAKEVERLRATAAVKTPLFLIDHDDDKNKTSQLNIAATPVLQFYVGGVPLTIRRTDHADDDKLVGSFSRERLVELLQSARTAENEGSQVLYVDF